MASLLAKLSLSLGATQAAIEIGWMRQAVTSPHALQLMVDRRTQGEPLQYILGTQPFGPLNLITRSPTLIPRPETEQWTSALATKIRPTHHSPIRVLDICTGSGCIPLLLCHLLHLDRSRSRIQMAALGIDISPSACQLAHDNISWCGLPPGYSLDIQQKSVFDDDFWEFVKQAFREPRMHVEVGEAEPLQLDVVTANPPYIPRDQWRRLPPEVKDWEDPLALLGDPYSYADGGAVGSLGKGLTFYKRIRDLLSCPDILSRQSVLAMEVGEGQAGDVAKIFDNGFGRLEVWKDWWGKERAVFIYGEEWS